MKKDQLLALIEEMTQNLFIITDEVRIKRLEKAIRCYLLQLSKVN